MKKRYKLISFAVVILLLGFILTKIGFKELMIQIKQANPYYLLVSFLAITLTFIIWNLRWYLIIRKLKKINFFAIFPIFMSGIFINTVTPGARVGGEPVRSYFLSKKYKIPYSDAFAATISDKLYNFIVFGALTVFSILFVLLYIKLNLIIRVILLILLVLILMIFAFAVVFNKRLNTKYFRIQKILPVFYKTFKSIRLKFATSEKFEEYVIKKIDHFLITIKKSMKNGIIPNLAATSAYWFFYFISVNFLFIALGYSLGFVPVLIVVTLSILLGDISPTPGGIGIIETMMIALYFSFGITASVAAAVTLVSRAMYYFYALIIGGVSFSYFNSGGIHSAWQKSS